MLLRVGYIVRSPFAPRVTPRSAHAVVHLSTWHGSATRVQRTAVTPSLVSLARRTSVRASASDTERSPRRITSSPQTCTLTRRTSAPRSVRTRRLALDVRLCSGGGRVQECDALDEEGAALRDRPGHHSPARRR